MAEPQRPALTDEEICNQARSQLHAIEEFDGTYRGRALVDLRFSVGDQWPSDTRKVRETTPNPRPCLVVNRTEDFVMHEVNEFRQNRPDINVLPANDGTDVATAEVVQGLIRQISRESAADIAYETGVDHQIRMGRGYWRIILEWADPMSFDLVPRIKRIRNPLSVFLDANSQEPDGSDARYGFIIQHMTHAEFERTYPQADCTNFPAFIYGGEGWVTKDTVRVAEYFFTEWRRQTIARLRDGQILPKEDVQNTALIVEERVAHIPQIWQTKLNGHQVLETFAWPGAHIPIVPVIGLEEEIDGRVELKGMVRNMIDPQRTYNYLASLETELLSMAPKAPYVGPERFMEGHEIMWREANSRNFPALEYHPTMGPNGQLNPPPQRQIFEPPIQAISQQRALALDDIRGVTGIHQPTLGIPGSERSGIALREQKQQSDTANFHFFGNANRSIRQTGVILVDLIPKVYNRERVIRIVGADDVEEVIRINAQTVREGKGVLFDVRNARFDVAISTGPSFTTKRQEAAESMVRLTQAYPEMVKLIGDLMVGNMDFPDSQEAAQRIKRAIPPEILGTDEELSPEQLQAMLAQLQQQLKQLNAYAVEREQEVTTLQDQQKLLVQQINDKTQENAIKAGQLRLDREALLLKTDLDARKLDIEEQTKNRDLDVELQTKNRDMDLDAAELALKARDNGLP